jgi:hypothetical protein
MDVNECTHEVKQKCVERSAEHDTQKLMSMRKQNPN